MISDNAKILGNEFVGADVYHMILSTKISPLVQAGQFVQVQVPGYYLRRPISVSEVDEKGLHLYYKVVGSGTDVMSHLTVGTEVNLFGPLGNGFAIEDKDVVLIGGGVGVPPLVETAKQYIHNKHNVTVVLGFNAKEQVFLKERFEACGCKVFISTMDGSEGTKGTVIDCMKENDIDGSFVEACGPLPMLKAIATNCEGYISLESRMACGLGACMGCVVKDHNNESKRVCKEGPVFKIGEVIL